MRQIRSTVPAPRRTLERNVTGTSEYVADTVRLLRESGRLVAMTEPQQNSDGRVWVNVRFLDRQQPAAAARRQRRWPAVAAAGAGVTVLGVAAYALIQLVNAVIAALPIIGAGLLLLALVALPTRARSSGTFSGTFTGRMD